MSKYTENFKKTILAKLRQIAADDPLFAKSFSKKEKNIDDCINYILNTVHKSGVQGFTDDEVYAMAVHYYDEDDIKKPGAMQCHVVVNHAVQLSEEEIQEAKKQAKEDLFRREQQRMLKKPSVTTNAQSTNQPTLF